jgi:hypothetical protein
MGMYRDTREYSGEGIPWIITFLILLFLVSVGGAIIYRVTLPMNIATENAAFHNGQPYTDGMRRELDDYMTKYYALPETMQGSREVIRSAIMHDYAGYDSTGLPSDLQTFLKIMKDSTRANQPAPMMQQQSDDVQRQQQEQITMRITNAVGMPSITKFAEKKMLKAILEARDQFQPTFAYTQDMQGRLHFLCNSLGYGLPYATQYTNPLKVAYNNAVIAQADPNGLYSPSSAAGTWVYCNNPATRQMEVQYVEPNVVVTTFPMANTLPY